jgi:hypothetical protein
MICGHHAVLEEHGFSVNCAVFESSFPFSKRNTMEFKDVPIIGDNVMDFYGIASIGNDFWLQFRKQINFYYSFNQHKIKPRNEKKLFVFTVVMKHSGSLITLRSSEGWRMCWNISLICVKGLLIKGDKIVRVSRVKKQYTTIKLARDWKNVEVFEPFIFF